MIICTWSRQIFSWIISLYLCSNWIFYIIIFRFILIIGSWAR